MTHPENGKVQVTVFGPGFGESILIHIGDRSWIIIDSCLNDSRKPAALDYLKSIGVDVASEVFLIVATHWHDDHIKGLKETLLECESARFAMSSALTRREFLAYLIAYDAQPDMNTGRGGSEIISCLRIVKKRGQPAIPVVQDRKIIDWPSGHFSHQQSVELLALSPSDMQFSDALLTASEFPDLINKRTGAQAVPKKRISSENKNDLSVAILLTVGNNAVILGADVEERNDGNYGWLNIVNNRKGREPRPKYLKVAHHGSEGAHLDALWSDVLTTNAISVVTPWSRGGNLLPTAQAKQKLRELSDNAYITSTEIISLKKRYDRDVLKHISRSGVELLSTVYRCGSVTLLIDSITGGLEDVCLTESAAKL
ncbi:hypothetical protein SAMN05444339_101153 [Loktanella atrilutea]|uniref:Metallo-beta-lactamase superfamily protein n=1 Tax=Loktanella atrilutea TaxID=366533 RepID=A0A1M4SVB2_LOKAT|nr:hypothetical protein [Loktanella atrilutea]SHE36145.1 hypothetical protein SAMN05444339_101153 [Loktanella atrilutea]